MHFVLFIAVPTRKVGGAGVGYRKSAQKANLGACLPHSPDQLLSNERVATWPDTCHLVPCQLRHILDYGFKNKNKDHWRIQLDNLPADQHGMAKGTWFLLKPPPS